MYILYTNIFKVYVLIYVCMYIYILSYLHKRKQFDVEYVCMLRHSQTVSTETLFQLATLRLKLF
jgi:hypothetical protein